ncbi:vegetative cell wall protein gp1-like isoform X2 [Zalophus californianus]|uniref:Vegetative cell wall protein gp1-like isoform X2 n=1 Tax=Zalophus californianus TaxID=9704 RepID=A0A6P9EXZ4_ZALCA|nr:vegetative cell wall protein gp1-like isoform X2 [Zalophus californianus]
MPSGPRGAGVSPTLEGRTAQPCPRPRPALLWPESGLRKACRSQVRSQGPRLCLPPVPGFLTCPVRGASACISVEQVVKSRMAEPGGFREQGVDAPAQGPAHGGHSMQDPRANPCRGPGSTVRQELPTPPPPQPPLITSYPHPVRVLPPKPQLPGTALSQLYPPCRPCSAPPGRLAPDIVQEPDPAHPGDPSLCPPSSQDLPPQDGAAADAGGHLSTSQWERSHLYSRAWGRLRLFISSRKLRSRLYGATHPETLAGREVEAPRLPPHPMKGSLGLRHLPDPCAGLRARGGALLLFLLTGRRDLDSRRTGDLSSRAAQDGGRGPSA